MLLLRGWPAVFALVLARPALHGALTAYADPVLGFDAVLCLLACLAVTPVITVTRSAVTRLRWWYGNWVFALGAAGLALHLAAGSGSAAARTAGTAVDWTGTVIVVLLAPMAATSSAAAQKLLGPEWKRWQRWGVWAVWVLVGAHLALIRAWLVLGAYLAVSAPAIAVRQPPVRKAVKAWRAGGYSTGEWWFALTVGVVLAAAGATVLVSEEVSWTVRAVLLR